MSYRADIASFNINKARITIFLKYFEFADVFSSELASELSKYTKINDYAINLINDMQPFYRPIYSLELIEFRTLKTYIETDLANGFIRSSKCVADA